MSLEDYENFVFDACLQDWKKNTQNLNKLLSLFKKGKTVELIGENVDLKFKIRGKLAEADRGEENMPGGEIFVAPEKKSVEGHIKFDYPAIETGNEVSGIYLEFKQGRVVKSRADKNEEFLRQMLGADANASYLGEFGIGCNPRINRFTKNLLFDEKINGTIHLALGMAYKENGGGNDSAIHWDIVKSMRHAKIVLDGRIIQKDGVWQLKKSSNAVKI
ncbi:MAG: leucyl aminopeptidase [Candidatus Berkelbacteria bacterium Licking1014_96]|uniref:Leucyl aminopeptidase n=1 Tax=Candidatus Berkelbacteria bacterium Licking1014_96 TaxID=2017149 RepID=A0A554LCL7_9BACT|nr:MAG: leucyl aminopeptidase [Candidatus Berkelbacteria bacterium Licking1014_96]